ncbi:N-methylhydantoinase A [Lentibacillus halodurans]|uniref:N-methylhydantoinase A n=1 Tax=Lentibacillus halodurans TaxID=237679 RepID=A0A1I0ZHE8_9BACI|nr:hydantoinase/oxoprolinase family protein [Lentibacillus halodurans]SFB23970.1 N-methylhydantoinase A [Lentibacillus halodurans]
MGYRLGIDIGGTFTDLYLFDEINGKSKVLKVPSNVNDPSISIEEGIQELLSSNQVEPSSINYLAHGTTVGTNTAIERKGATTALITTKGFRDLLELGRQARPSIYNLFEDKPSPLIKREFRKEVTERLKYDGSIDKELNFEEAESIIKNLKTQNIESFVVCFLHSYTNPTHEKQIKKLINKHFPDIYVSLSSEVLPEYREFERFSTTTINGYLGPKISQYVSNLANRVKKLGIETLPYINQSNSGVMSIQTTKENPARTALSGPSAGVAGASHISKVAGFNDIITFDMGGTSTDVSLIQNGEPKITVGKKVAGFPLNLPMTDVHAVGAGGGSIAWVDNGGILKVGPHSAGATPGPAAYGGGGLEPTVTDANVILQRLNPNYILGGEMEVDYEAAKQAIQDKVANPLNISLSEAAKGIITIVHSNIIRALRVISVEQGFDPREFTLVAFGGAGSLHSAYVAKEVGIKHVLIPQNSGILSALGLLTSDLKMDFVKTRLLNAKEENLEKVMSEFETLSSDGINWLEKEEVASSKQKVEQKIDMRYLGQNYELSISLDCKLNTREDLDYILEKFHKAHEKNYGYSNPNEEVEFINYRVTAIGEVPKISLKKYRKDQTDPYKARIAQRNVFFDKEEKYITTNIYDRSLLMPNNKIEGPAIVEQMDSTIVIPPGVSAEIDEYLNIILTL